MLGELKNGLTKINAKIVSSKFDVCKQRSASRPQLYFNYIFIDRLWPVNEFSRI